MKKEKKANDKAQQEFESSFFYTARNLIHGELSLLPRHFVFPTVSQGGERETRTGDEAQGRRATLSGDTWPTISAGALFSNKRAAKSVYLPVCDCESKLTAH